MGDNLKEVILFGQLHYSDSAIEYNFDDIFDESVKLYSPLCIATENFELTGTLYRGISVMTLKQALEKYPTAAVYFAVRAKPQRDMIIESYLVEEIIHPNQIVNYEESNEEKYRIINYNTNFSLATVFYGAGNALRKYIKAYDKCELNIVAVCDRNPDLWGLNKYGLEVMSLERAKETFGDINIIVSIEELLNEVIDYLLNEKKIPPRRIVNYRAITNIDDVLFMIDLRGELV